MDTIKILLIDDDIDMRTSIKALLTNHNEAFQISEAASGKEGLQKVKEIQPDLIVLDIMMESVDEGYNINQFIKFQGDYEDHHNTPIIMLSSIKEKPYERFAQAGGSVEMITPDYYMTKPVNVEEFLKLVDEIL